MPKLDGAIDFAQLGTPAAATLGRTLLYPKSGDRLFVRGLSSPELPVGCDSFICTSTTRPASPFSGMQIFETDTKNTLLYDGVATAWKYVGNRCICTSTTRPTGSTLTVGLEIFETDTGKIYNWYGGAWVQQSPAAGANELGYAQIVANATANTSGAVADVTGLAVTVTVGTRPIVIEGYMSVQHTVATAGFLVIYIYEGATLLQQTAIYEYGQAGSHTIFIKHRLAPSAGSHTYKIRCLASAGNIQVMASSTNPGSIHVVEV